MALSYVLLETCLGWVGLLGSPVGLTRLVLPQSSRDDAVASLGVPGGDIACDVSAFGELPDRLRRYLAGEKLSFPDKVDFGGATAFYQQVWEVTRGIPYGETRSYAEVAKEVGRPGAARALGQAMARNLVPLVVPCHRVIASDGRLGGYGGGVEMKRYLLEMECRSALGNSPGPQP